MKLRFKVLFLFFSICCIVIPFSSAQVVIPDKPANYVVDPSGIIEENIENMLNEYLIEFDQKTSSKMIVFTINNLNGESIEQFANETMKKWGLGQKDKDKSVFLLVSIQDRKYRFEISYGLKDMLPDSFAGNIGNIYLVPYFKKKEYSKGILAATLAVICKIASDLKVETSWMSEQRVIAKEELRVIAEEEQRVIAEEEQRVMIAREVRDRYDKFMKKNDVNDWPSMESLLINPFIYKGKKVAILSTFNTMITATKGIFKADGKHFVVSDIPKGLFKSKERVVLAGRVLGKTEIKMGLSLLVPHLKYAKVHFCKDWQCSDIIPNLKNTEKNYNISKITEKNCNILINSFLKDR